MLTVAEVAARTGLSESRVREIAAMGEWEGQRRFGGAWAIPDPPRRTVERPRGRPRKERTS